MAEVKTTTKPKMVKIRLPLTRAESEDKYVAVNCKSFLIKRGVTVEVPEYVAKVIERQEEMEMRAMEYEAQLAERMNAKELQ